MNPRRHADTDAEAGILGGIFCNNAALGRVADLEVQDFYDPRHQSVFMAMRNLDIDGIDALDPVTVAAELKRLGKAASLGGSMGEDGCIAFLLELMMRPTTPDNVERYAGVLKKHRTSRELRIATGEILERLDRDGDEECEGDGAVQWALGRLMRIRARGKDPGRTLGELMRDELDQLEADLAAMARGENVAIGIPTGVRALDEGTGGYPLGAVSLIMGPTGHGKSTLLGAGARATAAGGDLALVYSFEDPMKFWAQRGIGQESGVPTEAIARRRDLDKALQARAPGAGIAARLSQTRSSAWRRGEVIIPSADWTVEDVISDVRNRRIRMQAQLGGKKRRLGVFVDYVQVMKLIFSRGIEKRTEAIAQVMNRFQWLAQGGGTGDECAVVVASQVKDDVVKERRAPRIDDWADSYSTVKVAKLVIGINRPGKYDAKANQLLGSIDVLKRNQGDDEVHAEVILDLAIHTIRDIGEVTPPTQQSFGATC